MTTFEHNSIHHKPYNVTDFGVVVILATTLVVIMVIVVIMVMVVIVVLAMVMIMVVVVVIATVMVYRTSQRSFVPVIAIIQRLQMKANYYSCQRNIPPTCHF